MGYVVWVGCVVWVSVLVGGEACVVLCVVGCGWVRKQQ